MQKHPLPPHIHLLKEQGEQVLSLPEEALKK